MHISMEEALGACHEALSVIAEHLGYKGPDEYHRIHVWLTKQEPMNVNDILLLDHPLAIEWYLWAMNRIGERPKWLKLWACDCVELDLATFGADALDWEAFNLTKAYYLGMVNRLTQTAACDKWEALKGIGGSIYHLLLLRPMQAGLIAMVDNRTKAKMLKERLWRSR